MVRLSNLGCQPYTEEVLLSGRDVVDIEGEKHVSMNINLLPWGLAVLKNLQIPLFGIKFAP